MAIRYVSNAGSNTSPYDTWAKAATTLATAITGASAGDIFYLSSTHTETTAGSITLNSPGTAASPCVFVSASTAAEPPTTATAGATINTSGSTTLTIGTGVGYWYGITFHVDSASSGAVGQILISAAALGYHKFESCTFRQGSNHAAQYLAIYSSTGHTHGRVIEWINCVWRPKATGHKIFIDGTFLWKNSNTNAIDTTDATPTTVFDTDSATGAGGVIHCSGLDLDQCSGNLVNVGSNKRILWWFTNCKLHASATKVTGTHQGPGNQVVWFDNCQSGDVNYDIHRNTYEGTVDDETTLVRTSGASDGTTALSWKMVTTANAEWAFPLESPEIVQWNDTTGSAKTATIEILHDSATNLKDNEIWLEIEYLGTSGNPMTTFAHDGIATYLTTAADQTTSSEAWTTTGMANPNKQKLSVSFTPQEKGLVKAKVKVAKTSYTVYVCPLMSIA